MPLYDIRCKCGYSGETFARVSELSPSNRVPCPKCASMADQVLIGKTFALGGAAKSFHGRRRHSITEGFHSTEVGEARQIFGDVGHCIQDDGSVVFSDRAEQQKYMGRKAEVYMRGQENAALASKNDGNPLPE